MMYARNVVLGIVAATVTFAAADNPKTPAPPSPVGFSCLDSCDCMPKLCTDDAVIKGTTTHLTYLCPETKTVQVTETIFVTVHDGGSQPPTASTSAPGDDEKTTTLIATSKSTLFITKTIMSKHPTSSSLSETPVPVSNSLVSSSAEVAISKPNYTEPSVPIQNHPEPTTTVHVASNSTTTVLETVSANPELPNLHSPVTVTNSLRPTGLILTNPLRPSPTASGIWLNTTTSDAGSQSSSGTESNSTLYLTMVPHATSTAASVSTDGIATSSAVNSTLTLVMPSVTGPIPTPPIPGYGSSSVFSMINSTLTLVMPSVTPGLPPVGHPRPSAFLNVTMPDDRPTSGFVQLTVSVSDNFISLPSDTETSWSIVGDESTMTDMESFPTIEPDFPAVEESTMTDMESFPTIEPDFPTAEVSVSTDGTFFSSDIPPHPTAAPVKRHDGEHEGHVDGTISKVHMTITVALRGKNSTVTATGSTGTVSGSYPGATTKSLGHNGASNTQPWPAWVVVIVILPFLAARF